MHLVDEHPLHQTRRHRPVHDLGRGRLRGVEPGTDEMTHHREIAGVERIVVGGDLDQAGTQIIRDQGGPLFAGFVVGHPPQIRQTDQHVAAGSGKDHVVGGGRGPAGISQLVRGRDGQRHEQIGR